MVDMEKNVEKQLIVRTFEPDMGALKAAARQLRGLSDLGLNLYGQSGEVLIVITARSHAAAAATELTERVAEQLETALGEAAYGRGKGSLAYFAAGELMENEALIAASDSKTGALLAEEFSHTKRGNNVFDFGDSSYSDSRVMAKMKETAAKHFEPGDDAQMAAARAAAASKCARAEVGVSIVGNGVAGKDVYLAVAYKGHVYMRRFPQAQDTGKKAALAALDITRRLMADLPVSAETRVFKANSNFDWDAPVQAKQKNKALVPIIVLAVLLVALIVACWYFLTHFSLFGADSNTAPAGGSSASVSAGAPASTSPVDDAGASVSLPDAGSGSAPASVPASSSSQEIGGQVDDDGTVHPFA